MCSGVGCCISVILCLCWFGCIVVLVFVYGDRDWWIWWLRSICLSLFVLGMNFVFEVVCVVNVFFFVVFIRMWVVIMFFVMFVIILVRWFFLWCVFLFGFYLCIICIYVFLLCSWVDLMWNYFCNLWVMYVGFWSCLEWCFDDLNVKEEGW